MATDIGPTPVYASVMGGGHFHSSEGGLVYVHASVAFQASFTWSQFTVVDQQGKTLGNGFKLAQVGYQADTGVLTFLGTLTWHGSETDCALVVTRVPGNAVAGVLVATIGGVTLDHRTDGYINIVAA